MSLEPDPDEIGHFVDALFRYADPHSFVSLRAFPDRSGQRSWRHPVTTADNIVGPATSFARRCANAPFPVVFCPPVATFNSTERARAEDLVNGLALSVECDAHAQAARERLEWELGPATVVVASGGLWINPETGLAEPKLHLHWRLSEPTRAADDHAKLRVLRQAACKLVEADATNVPMVHPIRWPGSWHRKAEPRLATIIDSADAEIKLDLALAVLPQAQEHEEHAAGEPLADVEEVKILLAGIPLGESQSRPGEYSWREWNRVGMATFAATQGSVNGMNAFEEWSARFPALGRQSARSRWAHYRRNPPGSIGVGTLRYLHSLDFVDDIDDEAIVAAWSVR